MVEEEKKDLKQINDELKELGKPRAKAPFVVFFFIGFAMLVAGAVYLATDGYIVGGAIMLGLGVALFLVCGFAIAVILYKNSKIEELEQQRDELSTEQKPENIGKEENKEDTLLRLLSEGKITVEEYKKLNEK